MQAVRIDRANPRPLGAPGDWTEENGHCGGLFIREELIAGVNYMRSAWEAEPEEALLLLGGAKVLLGVAGRQHPVVSLGVGQLPPDFAPVATVRQFAALDGTPAIRVEMLFDADGGRRGFAECRLDVGRTWAESVQFGIEQVTELARREGWIAPDWGKL